MRAAARAAAMLVPVLLASCGDGGTQKVAPKLVPPAQTLDFGAVAVLNLKRLDLRLLNAGRGALTVFSATIAEPDVPFAIADAPQRIGTGEEKPVGVTFVPPLEQDFQATLVLETDDEDNGTVRINLLGKGSTRAIMEVEPAAIAFGRVAEGTYAAQTQPLTVRSLGTADLIVEELAFTADSSPAFEFLNSVKVPKVVPTRDANGLPGSLALYLRYRVRPGTVGEQIASIRVRGTDPDRREVVVPVTGQVNRAPVPLIAPLGAGAPGIQVRLDGSGSTDPDGDLPLTYQWTLTKPLGATTRIDGPQQPVTTMTLDPEIPGEYVVELDVTDAAGARNLFPARASIIAAPAQKLLVEMFWNKPLPDVDLHFLRNPSATLGTAPDDCFFQNPAPDWGVTGVTSDDPRFVRDALTGNGPELLGYVNPVDGTYRVIAEYKNDHLASDPAAEVTVRIYEYGVVRFETRKVLSKAGDVWRVADIDWPSGAITPSN